MNRENQRDKDLKNTYLRVNREGKYGEAFEENLLYKQSVPGLLSFYEVQEEGEAVLVYGLNHKKSCLEVLEGKRMDCEWMGGFYPVAGPGSGNGGRVFTGSVGSGH